MEEKKLTEKESLDLITAMIARTKDRYIGDGNIMLMWGYLTVGVTLTVWALLAATRNPAWNWLWFLIMTVGGILTPVLAGKEKKVKGVKTYSDRIVSGIWTAVGISAVVCSVCCLLFQAVASITGIWSMMFIFALVIVPFAEIAQGIVIREISFVWGGGAGLLLGIFTMCCIAGHVTLYANWYLPLFCLAFIVMMIVPGHILNYKARHRE